MADEILTVAEVAQLLKVADKTVYPMAQKSEPPFLRGRGQWRFRRQYLDSWMALQKTGPAKAEQPEAKPKAPARMGGTRR